jgi:trehalose utilization protein
MALNVTIWNEFRHEREEPRIAAIYPDGIHAAIASGLAAHGDFSIRTATLDEPEHGLTENVLATTDVLIWWGHKAQSATTLWTASTGVCCPAWD